jgi:hypothetical protein
VSVESLIAFIVSAATDAKLYVDEAWAKTSFAAQTMRRAVDRPTVPLPRDELQTLLAYWFHQYPATPDRTRGNVVASVTAKLDRFLHGRLKAMFCRGTTIVPEMTFHGAIILMALPVLTFGLDGVIAQQLVKYLFQVAVEGRNALPKEHRDRPICLWMDEAHYYIAVTDDAFLSTCRSSRACVVAISQSLPSYYAALGKDKTDAIDGLLGKFNTHVFHLNSCPRTNAWASSLLGRGLQYRETRGGSVGRNWSGGMNQGTNVNRNTGSSSSSGTGGGGFNHSAGSSRSDGSGENWGANVGNGRNEGASWSAAETMDNIVEANLFSKGLRSGGPANGNRVDAILFRAGARFRQSGGQNYMRVTFKQ